MFRRAAAIALTVLFANALTVAASEKPDVTASTAPIAAAIARAAAAAADGQAVVPWSEARPLGRPAMLPVLYGTFATMQVLDVVTTKRALNAGADEANPILRSGNMATTIAIRAATGAATVYFVERAWKRHRVGAILLMTAINGASAAVVAHNHGNAARR